MRSGSPLLHRSGSHFRLQIGQNIEPGGVRGYYIDLTEKARAPEWSPERTFSGTHRFISLGQWGLAAMDRYMAGEGERWLAGAVAAGEHLVAEQVRSGPRRGAWEEPEAIWHTYRLRGPWISGMAQGLCASLLVRLHLETTRGEFAAAAVLASAPYRVPSEEGGFRARLPDGRGFPEEYPTRPASYVLNGAIYALWGLYDVHVGLGDSDAGHAFDATVDALADNLHRWDLGYWSRYDLYQHPLIVNVASTSYHLLHINQLRVLARMTERCEFDRIAQRFARYAASRVHRARALAHKIAFRVVVPRNRVLVERLPWLQDERPRG
jgi:heparosan-N-sulfate-glucuronate 5-epimerase